MADSLYQHVPLYRMLHDERRSDLPFYLRVTEGRAAVLEYGVGHGRVALPLAREGRTVVGVDLSAPMLAELEARRQQEPEPVRDRLRPVLGDARELRLDERFDAVICPYNGISHHHDLEQLGAFLDRVREHLRPGGVFAFDVVLPDPSLLTETSSEVPWFRDPVDGAVCRATERTQYDPLRQLLTVTTTVRAMEVEREPLEMVLRLRLLFPEETRLLLRHHGWEIVRREADLGDVIGYVCRTA